MPSHSTPCISRVNGIHCHMNFDTSTLPSPPTCPLLPRHTQLGLPPAKLWSVDQVFGGWAMAQERFFDAGA